MDFILNSKTKKVEIFYENETEQQAVLSFMSKYLTYREDKTTPNLYIHDPGPGISWANAISTTPYTISTTDDLSGTITLNNNAVSTINIAEASAKLDNLSDEGGYSCLTASVPHKTK